MLPMIRWFMTAFMTLCIQTGYCQFTDSTQHLAQYTSTGSINGTNDSRAYLLNNQIKIGIRKKSVSLNFNNSWMYGKQNQQLTNNDFSSTFDFNLYNTPNFFYWGLANYNTSRSLKINNQLLSGVGAAYSIFNRDEAYLNISDGLLFDASDIISPEGIRDKYETIRNSLRLSFRFVVFENIVFSNTAFLQSALSNKDDYIARTDAALTFKVNQWLGLTTSYYYNYISRTERENYLLSYGLTFERYF
jgi:hypothetical protein